LLDLVAQSWLYFSYTEDDNATKPAQHAAVKAELAAEAEVKAEEPYHNQDQGGGGDDQDYKDDQDMDDEIDFNLGNGNSHDVSAGHEAHGPGIKEDG